jgi:hypothetical protein
MNTECSKRIRPLVLLLYKFGMKEPKIFLDDEFNANFWKTLYLLRKDSFLNKMKNSKLRR